MDPADLQEAEHAILEAIRIQQEIGARPELGRSYVSYACLLKGRGEREKAREFLANAITMFQEMGMVWDLERAEQAGDVRCSGRSVASIIPIKERSTPVTWVTP